MMEPVGSSHVLKANHCSVLFIFFVICSSNFLGGREGVKTQEERCKIQIKQCGRTAESIQD